MASAQVALDQAAFEELVKKAQSQATGKGKIGPQDQVFLLGQFKNGTQGPVKLHASHTWSGLTYITLLPPVIASNTTAEFEQVGKLENGIKSAAIYAGRETNQVGWLVAWFNPKDLENKKVYVECGPIEKFNNISWEEIERRLSNSTNESSFIDPLTRTAVQARIVPPLTKSTSDGILVATFLG